MRSKEKSVEVLGARVKKKHSSKGSPKGVGIDRVRAPRGDDWL